ncbi:MAG: hypothetical protein AB1664_23930 [Thermodesulfobacteriota bacterium]
MKKVTVQHFDLPDLLRNFRKLAWHCGQLQGWAQKLADQVEGIMRREGLEIPPPDEGSPDGETGGFLWN